MLVDLRVPMSEAEESDRPSSKEEGGTLVVSKHLWDGEGTTDGNCKLFAGTAEWIKTQ